MSAPYDSIDAAIKAMFAPETCPYCGGAQAAPRCRRNMWHTGPESFAAETRAHLDRAYASLSRLRDEVQRQELEAAERRTP